MNSSKKKIVREAYDKIALSWNRLRNVPFPWVVDYLKRRKGSLLIEGCGSGRHSAYASLKFPVTAFDLSFEMIKLAKKNDKKGRYIVADACHLPFKDKVFEHGLSIALFHHLNPDELIPALKELRRVTKGDSLISVWKRKRSGEQFIKWGNAKRYYYIYQTDEFKKIVSSVFNIKKDVSDEKNIILVIS